MKLLNSLSRVASLLLIVGCTGGSFSLPSAVSNGGNQSLGSGGSTVATPTPVPGSSATPTPSTIPANVNIAMGVNGHDGRQYYTLANSENLFKLLDSKNLRSYRVDADPRNFTLLDEMVRLQKKYNVNVRPMMYPLTKADGYTLAKKYGADIKIWEIGNEQDYSKTGAQDRINAIVTMYQGMKQASDELGLNLKFTLNVMACNSDYTGADARCPNDKNGAIWFLDMAKASGFNFDYVSFHYYAGFGDKGYWYDMYLGQARAIATKFKTKLFLNETNCAEIYQGNTDGGKAGDKSCYDSVKQLLTELNTNYKDVFQEINMYELLDEPNNDGVEAHFGLMKDLATPKELFNLVTSFAK